jgi:hypothetical protein
MRGRMLVTLIAFVLLRKEPRLATIAAAVGVATSLFTAVPYMHSRASTTTRAATPASANGRSLGRLRNRDVAEAGFVPT